MSLLRHQSIAILASVGLLLALAPACAGDGDHGAHRRHLAAETIVLELPETLGHPDRPVVEFRHGAHAKALESEGCQACHAPAEKLVFDVALTKTVADALASAEDLDGYMEAYHGFCLGCHQDRSAAKQATGPLSCGECHVRHRGEAVVDRVPYRFDLAMHQRHSAAESDRCETCHHVYDEEAGRLVAGEGQESSCRDCHRAEAEENRASLRDASHGQCVGCHLERGQADGDAGPVTCEGCHDAERIASFEGLVRPPRLKRGQPDQAWIHTKGASSKMVAFDHADHETWAERCSTCHHETLRPCGECHTVGGSAEGGGVTLEKAYHDPSSERSCIGCHQKMVRRDPNCIGCHALMPPPPSARSCDGCHRGSEQDAQDPAALAAALAVEWAPELPSPSALMPEQVVISVLADTYEPSELPHYQVAAMYDTIVRTSKLASRFHRDVAVPCGACHHHTPPGDRPPPCRACHTEEGDATRDIPGLRAAYHRQCMGCHQAAGLGTGCTDCHREAQERGQR